MDYSFVRVTVDRATIVILGDDIPHEVDLMDWYLSAPERGYKISLSKHIEKNSYIASMTGKDSANNKGLVLSQWGGDAASAIRKLYIVAELLCPNENWGLAESRMDDLLKELIKSQTG